MAEQQDNANILLRKLATATLRTFFCRTVTLNRHRPHSVHVTRYRGETPRINLRDRFTPSQLAAMRKAWDDDPQYRYDDIAERIIRCLRGARPSTRISPSRIALDVNTIECMRQEFLAYPHSMSMNERSRRLGVKYGVGPSYAIHKFRHLCLDRRKAVAREK